LLEKEKTIAKLKHQISKDVEKKVQDQHRKYLLQEQMKAIKVSDSSGEWNMFLDNLRDV